MSNRTLNLIVSVTAFAIATSSIAITNTPHTATTSHPASIRAPAPHVTAPAAPHTATPSYVAPPTPYKPPVNPAIQNITRVQPPTFLPPASPQKTTPAPTNPYGEFLRQEAALNNRTITSPAPYNPKTGAGQTSEYSQNYLQQQALQQQRAAEQSKIQRQQEQQRIQQLSDDARRKMNQGVVDRLHQEARYRQYPNESPTYKAVEAITPVVKAVRDAAPIAVATIAQEVVFGEKVYGIKPSTIASNMKSAEKSVAKTTAIDNMQAGSIRSVNPTGSKTNCVNCAVTADQMLRGNYASALPSGPKNISEIEAIYGRNFSSPTNIGDIASKMAKAGNGSQGIVFGSRGSEIGHVFNVVNQNGTVRFLDSQSGQAAIINNGYKYFQFLVTK